MPIILKSSFLLTFHTCLVGSDSLLKRPLLFIVLYPPWSSNQIGWVFLLNPLISNTVCWWILSLHIRNSPEPQTSTIHPQYLQLFRSNRNPSSGLTTYALLNAPCSKQWPPPPAHTPTQTLDLPFSFSPPSPYLSDLPCHYPGSDYSGILPTLRQQPPNISISSTLAFLPVFSIVPTR